MEVRRRKHSNKNEDSTTFVENVPQNDDLQEVNEQPTTTSSTILSSYVATPQWLLKTLMDWLFISMDYVREKLADYIPILEPGLQEITKYYYC